MKNTLLLAFAVVLFTHCAPGSGRQNTAQDSKQNAPKKTGNVTFSGGHETDSVDRGRPVTLIGPALNVTAEIFRDAFSNVTPSEGGPPSHEEASANKKILLAALGPHGVTNDRLDEVSNYYRYNPSAEESWPKEAAAATAIIEDGKVTGFTITTPGHGYSSTPTVTVEGYPNFKTKVTLGSSTDFTKNGRVDSIERLD